MLDKNGNELELDDLYPLVIEEYGGNFLLKLTAQEPHFIEFDVYEIAAWSVDKKTDEIEQPCEIELYLSGYIKWDGCSHIWFGEEEDGKHDGYLHLCGKHRWDKHIQLMQELFDFASKKIDGFDPN